MKTNSNLFKKYFYSSVEELVKIIEYENSYTKETVATAKELLEGKAPGNNSIRRIASDLMHQRLKTYFGSFNIWNDELKVPTSRFLSESEVLKIFKYEYDKYISNREIFRSNLMMYMG